MTMRNKSMAVWLIIMATAVFQASPVLSGGLCFERVYGGLEENLL